MAASVLFVFPAVALNRRRRELVFENIENQAKGFGNIVRGIGEALDALIGLVGLSGISRAADSIADGMLSVANFLIEIWLLLIPATEFVYTILYAWAIHAAGGAVLRRLDESLTDPMSSRTMEVPADCRTRRSWSCSIPERRVTMFVRLSRPE